MSLIKYFTDLFMAAVMPQHRARTPPVFAAHQRTPMPAPTANPHLAELSSIRKAHAAQAAARNESRPAGGPDVIDSTSTIIVKGSSVVEVWIDSSIKKPVIESGFADYQVSQNGQSLTISSQQNSISFKKDGKNINITNSNIHFSGGDLSSLAGLSIHGENVVVSPKPKETLVIRTPSIKGVIISGNSSAVIKDPTKHLEQQEFSIGLDGSSTLRMEAGADLANIKDATVMMNDSATLHLGKCENIVAQIGGSFHAFCRADAGVVSLSGASQLTGCLAASVELVKSLTAAYHDFTRSKSFKR